MIEFQGVNPSLINVIGNTIVVGIVTAWMIIATVLLRKQQNLAIMAGRQQLMVEVDRLPQAIMRQWKVNKSSRQMIYLIGMLIIFTWLQISVATVDAFLLFRPVIQPSLQQHIIKAGYPKINQQYQYDCPIPMCTKYPEWGGYNLQQILMHIQSQHPNNKRGEGYDGRLEYTLNATTTNSCMNATIHETDQTLIEIQTQILNWTETACNAEMWQFISVLNTLGYQTSETFNCDLNTKRLQEGEQCTLINGQPISGEPIAHSINRMGIYAKYQPIVQQYMNVPWYSGSDCDHVPQEDVSEQCLALTRKYGTLLELYKGVQCQNLWDEMELWLDKGKQHTRARTASYYYPFQDSTENSNLICLLAANTACDECRQTETGQACELSKCTELGSRENNLYVIRKPNNFNIEEIDIPKWFNTLVGLIARHDDGYVLDPYPDQQRIINAMNAASFFYGEEIVALVDIPVITAVLTNGGLVQLALMCIMLMTGIFWFVILKIKQHRRQWPMIIIPHDIQQALSLTYRNLQPRGTRCNQPLLKQDYEAVLQLEAKGWTYHLTVGKAPDKYLDHKPIMGSSIEFTQHKEQTRYSSLMHEMETARIERIQAIAKQDQELKTWKPKIPSMIRKMFDNMIADMLMDTQQNINIETWKQKQSPLLQICDAIESSQHAISPVLDETSNKVRMINLKSINQKFQLIDTQIKGTLYQKHIEQTKNQTTAQREEHNGNQEFAQTSVTKVCQDILLIGIQVIEELSKIQVKCSQTDERMIQITQQTALRIAVMIYLQMQCWIKNGMGKESAILLGPIDMEAIIEYVENYELINIGEQQYRLGETLGKVLGYSTFLYKLCCMIINNVRSTTPKGKTQSTQDYTKQHTIYTAEQIWQRVFQRETPVRQIQKLLQYNIIKHGNQDQGEYKEARFVVNGQVEKSIEELESIVIMYLEQIQNEQDVYSGRNTQSNQDIPGNPLIKVLTKNLGEVIIPKEYSEYERAIQGLQGEVSEAILEAITLYKQQAEESHPKIKSFKNIEFLIPKTELLEQHVIYLRQERELASDRAKFMMRTTTAGKFQNQDIYFKRGPNGIQAYILKEPYAKQIEIEKETKEKEQYQMTIKNLVETEIGQQEYNVAFGQITSPVPSADAKSIQIEQEDVYCEEDKNNDINALALLTNNQSTLDNEQKGRRYFSNDSEKTQQQSTDDIHQHTFNSMAIISFYGRQPKGGYGKGIT